MICLRSKIDKKGFTLIELMIAVGIVALMASVAVTSINPAKRIGDANDAQRESDLINISKAIELYTADNGQLPEDFNVSGIAEGEKLVLCSSSDSLTCDGQTENCLVIDDTSFLGEYLADLPVDPEKTADTDTGYYITRGTGDSIVLGACNAYETTGVSLPTQVPMPTFAAVCGDNDVEGGEVCDDGNTTTETQTCGNSITESGSYCNADCSATITLNETCDNGYDESCGNGVVENGSYCNDTCSGYDSHSEVCEFWSWSNDCETIIQGIYATETDVGTGTWCNNNCTMYKGLCI